MSTRSKHIELLFPFLGHAVLLCCLSAVFTLAVAVGYGVLTSFGKWLELGIAGFLPSSSAWEASVFLGLALALFNTTGESVELDCDQGRTSHSAVTYGLALATTCLFALVLERGSHGNWLEPHFRSSHVAWAVFPGRKLMPTKTRAFIDMLRIALGAVD